MDENTKSENEQTPAPLTKGEREEIAMVLPGVGRELSDLILRTRTGKERELLTTLQIVLEITRRILSTADQWDVLRGRLEMLYEGAAGRDEPFYEGRKVGLETALMIVGQIAGTPSVAASPDANAVLDDLHEFGCLSAGLETDGVARVRSRELAYKRNNFPRLYEWLETVAPKEMVAASSTEAAARVEEKGS